MVGWWGRGGRGGEVEEGEEGEREVHDCVSRLDVVGR